MASRNPEQPANDMTASAGTGLTRLEFHPPVGEEAFELWREVGSPVFEVGARKPLPSFRAACEFYDVDGLIFAHNQFSSASFTREARHLRGGDSDFITLHFPIRGGVECGTVVERPHKMATDRISLQDWAHPYATVAEAVEKFGVMIPRDRMVARDWIYERQPTITWMLDSPQGRVLANAWMTLWQSLPHAQAEDAPTLAGGFLGLLNGLISPAPHDAQDAVFQQGLLPAMKRFLDSRLADPGLGIDQLVQAFRCSRSTVFRLFREHGGLQSYVRDQRLARCFGELTQRESAPARIRQVAMRWGFKDSHHFSRLFKKQFGITPSEAAEAIEQSVTAGALSRSAPARDQIATLHRWLQRR